MGMSGSILLLILGALAAEEQIQRFRPSLRGYLGLFAPLSGPLGAGATAYGLYVVLHTLAYLGFIRYAPTVFFTGLASGLCCIALGLVFGLKTARRWAGEDTFLGKTLRRAEPLAKLLARYKTALGLAGVVLAFVSLVINIFV
jgi:hypothetical protein